jgi:hypothetical protein
MYIPLDRLTHPTAEEPLTYDPRNLPLRTHTELYDQAMEVARAHTGKAADELARKYRIKGLPILYHVKSLRFPDSFPFDFMHLIWENLIPNLILLWTNQFKGLKEGLRDYTIDDAIWEAIGKQTAAAGNTIPSSFGARVPNLQNKGGVQVSAEMYATWVQFIAPTCLRNAFKRREYYDHFVRLVQILSKCLQFEITKAELQWLREKIPSWVEEYEKCVFLFSMLMKLTACAGSTTNTTSTAFPPVLSLSTPSSTFQMQSKWPGRSGATGRIPWNATAAVCSRESATAAFLTPPSTATFSNPLV